MPDIEQTLLGAPILRHLDPADQKRMLETGAERRLDPRQVLFCTGDRADAVYILVSGKIKLVRHTPQGKELLLHLVNPGESFAEAALLGDGTYPATAVALEPSVVYCWPRSRLIELLSNTPDLALGMVLSVSMWTRRLVTQLELLTQRRVEERLAIYLKGRSGGKRLMAGHEIFLREPRNLIAAQIGTVPEVLSRTFRRLEESGLVEITANKVRILDADGFDALAEHIEK